MEKVQIAGAYMQKKLLEIQERHPSMGDVRGIGLMWGIEYVRDKATKESFDPSAKFAATVAEHCKEMGLLVCSCGSLDMGEKGDASWIGPCFEITHEEIDEMLEIYEKAVAQTEKELM